MRRPSAPPSIRVFVYGTLKRGFGNHRLLADGNASFCGSASTVERYPLHVHGLPYLRCAPGEGHRVKGELYMVDEPTLARLDRLEGHPQFYSREEIRISAGAGAECMAWAYFIRRGAEGLAGLPMVPEYVKPLAMA